MKHFDVEIYAKEKLGGYSLTPNKSAWSRLLDKLYEEEQKDRSRRNYLKGIAFLVAFMFGIGFIAEEIDGFTNRSFTDNTINLIGQGHQVSQFAEKKVKCTKTESLPEVSERKEVVFIGHGIGAGMKNKVNKAQDNDSGNQDVAEHLETINVSVKSENSKVTEAEIDDLMRKARQNIERQKASQAMRKILAVEILAEIEQEIEHQQNRNSLSQNLKYGFVKLKDAIAN
ncbi:hypothetical protein [Ulvibacterium sp.]|uniref:hypothetical protein n=1 Tax=Ulvibacterium sp. TaxID=2665914 RepID=UPI003BA9C101